MPVSVNGRRLGILMLGIISCGALPLSIIMLSVVERPADDAPRRNEAVAAAAAASEDRPASLRLAARLSVVAVSLAASVVLVMPEALMLGPKLIPPGPLSRSKFISRLISPSPPALPPTEGSSIISEPLSESRRDEGLLMADNDAGPGVPNKLVVVDWEKSGEKLGGRAAGWEVVIEWVCPWRA